MACWRSTGLRYILARRICAIARNTYSGAPSSKSEILTRRRPSRSRIVLFRLAKLKNSTRNSGIGERGRNSWWLSRNSCASWSVVAIVRRLAWAVGVPPPEETEFARTRSVRAPRGHYESVNDQAQISGARYGITLADAHPPRLLASVQVCRDNCLPALVVVSRGCVRDQRPPRRVLFGQLERR